MNVLRDITDFYFKYEWKLGLPLSQSDAENTISNLLEKGCYECLYEGEKLIGYIETWKVNSSQLGRIFVGEEFDIYAEDIESGNICYVANAVIHPDFQKTQALSKLIRSMYETNCDSDLFIWRQTKSIHAPLRVYTANDLKRFFMKARV